jgi:predicted nucleic acid-binding protein
MSSSKPTCHLLDVNILIALTLVDHEHNDVVHSWFRDLLNLQWALCAFTEAGFIRNVISPRPGQISLDQATYFLRDLAQHPGYRYIAMDADWETLCGPLSGRLYGHKQVTDAYILGLAIRENLILVTLDKGIVHLAGPEYKQHVLLLEDTQHARPS